MIPSQCPRNGRAYRTVHRERAISWNCVISGLRFAGRSSQLSSPAASQMATSMWPPTARVTRCGSFVQQTAAQEPTVCFPSFMPGLFVESSEEDTWNLHSRLLLYCQCDSAAPFHFQSCCRNGGTTTTSRKGHAESYYARSGGLGTYAPSSLWIRLNLPVQRRLGKYVGAAAHI